MNKPATRVLLVDDNEMAAELMSEFLVLSGLDVRVANDGAQALVVCAEFNPAAVILDILLPDTDGVQLAHRLREQQQPAPRLIALTGLARAGHDAKSQVFDEWVEKPADPYALLALINRED